MGWETAIRRAAARVTFKAAWRRAQAVRTKTQLLTKDLFVAMVGVGIDVPSAPSLGRFTPVWEPLSSDWEERKGHGNFFIDTGRLGRTLLRKNPARVFGEPEVWLEDGQTRIKVTNRPAPKKYLDLNATNMKIAVLPFPKFGKGNPNEQVAGGSEAIFNRLQNPGGHYRPLVAPFVRWYVNVKLKRALK